MATAGACTGCPSYAWSVAGGTACTANAGYYDLGRSQTFYYAFSAASPLRDSSYSANSALTNTGGIDVSLGYASVTQANSTGWPVTQTMSLPGVDLYPASTLCWWHLPNTNATVAYSGQRTSRLVYTVGFVEIFADTQGLGVHLYANANGGQHIAWVRTPPGSCWTLNVWQHVCVAYNATNLAIYCNGTAQSQSSLVAVAPGAMLGSFGPFYKAQTGANDLFASGYKGLYEDYRLLNVSLSSTEASSLFSRGFGDASAMLMMPCAAGSYSTAAGATSSATCVPCAAGSYSSATGAGVACTACASGSYSSTAGATACVACSEGKYSTFSGGTTGCTLGIGSCPGNSQLRSVTTAGTLAVLPSTFMFKATIMRLNVANGGYLMVAGLYNNALTAFTDWGWRPALFQSRPNADMSISLNVANLIRGGYTFALNTWVKVEVIVHQGYAVMKMDGATLEVLGVAARNATYGTILHTSGAFTAQTANVSATFCQCDPGHFGDADVDNCTACPAGTYSAGAGQSACVQCAAGSYATAGATACTSCPPNTNTLPNAAYAGSALSCVCNRGFSCVYKKRMQVVILVQGLTLATFDAAARGQLVQRVAAAAKVQQSQVSIGAAWAYTGGRRRSLLGREMVHLNFTHATVRGLSLTSSADELAVQRMLMLSLLTNSSYYFAWARNHSAGLISDFDGLAELVIHRVELFVDGLHRMLPVLPPTWSVRDVYHSVQAVPLVEDDTKIRRKGLL